jgi:hypothetical protein
MALMQFQNYEREYDRLFAALLIRHNAYPTENGPELTNVPRGAKVLPNGVSPKYPNCGRFLSQARHRLLAAVRNEP